MRKFWLVGVLLLGFVDVRPNYNNVYVYHVTSSTIGPFEEFNEDSEVSLSYQVFLSASNIKEGLIVSNAVTKKTYYTFEREKHSLPSSKKYTAKFPLRTSYYLSQDGLTLDFYIKAGNETVYEASETIYPMERKDIYVTRDEIIMYKSSVSVLKIEDGNFNLIGDNYNFYNYSKFYDSDLHYGLDLSPFKFTYHSDSINYDSAHLYIQDSNNVLKNFEHIDGKIHLDLVPFLVGKQVNFKYKNKLFINKVNLESSDYFIPGFEETDQLIFPVNSKDDLMGSNIELVLMGCGYNKNNLFFNLEYNKGHNLVGSCYNSDYCVIGGVE